MKIKIKASIAGNPDARYGLEEFSFAPGQVVEVHETLAFAWIVSEIAEPFIEAVVMPETAVGPTPRKKAANAPKV